MKRLMLWLFPIVLVLSSIPVSGKIESGLPLTAPEEVGLSGNRLTRIRTVMNQHVAEKRIPGAIGLVARHGKIAYEESFGMADVETGKPMKIDTIHRIYSMTKPITSVAVMMLYEEGRFLLNDPVSKYIPELGKLQVGIEKKDPQTGETTLTTAPSKREMTIRDLLRHTSGLTYGFFGDTLVDRAYRKDKILSDLNLAEFITNLSKQPLLYEPGTRWNYSVSVDVLGRLVEVVSGKPLDQYFAERIFNPLKMVDTGFYVPANKKARLARLYSPTRDGRIRPAEVCNTRQECVDKFPNAAPSYLEPIGLLSGGGGLVSTAYDYLRFCQMMLNRGELDGVRLLSRKTVELMSSDHLGEIPMGQPGYGFGLGFAVNKAPGVAGMMGSVGEYNWGGAAGTKFWIDPKEDMIGIFMIQILPHTGLEYGSEFRVLAYQSIVD